MTDAISHAPLKLSTDGTAGPYIVLPVIQLSDVCQLFDRNAIRYWVDENAISLDGVPETVVVNLGRGADVDAIQAILN